MLKAEASFQAAVRRVKAVKKAKRLKSIKAATQIQAVWRGHRGRLSSASIRVRLESPTYSPVQHSKSCTAGFPFHALTYLDL